MNEISHEAEKYLTRRSFLSVLGAAGAALGMPARMLFSKSVKAAEPRGPVVSFHMDRPYLDWSGTAEPYYPPCGARSAQAVAHLSEEAFRRSHIYV
jgi:hypothetical protein